MFPESQIAADPRAVINLAVAARAQFLTRVYTHLFGALVGFTLLEVAYFQTGLAQRMTEAMLGTSWLLVMGAFIIVSMLATKVAFSSASKASQYMALGGFVLAESIIFVPLLWMANTYAGGGVIASAGFVSLAGFAGLTGIALFTRKDLSFLRPMLMWAGLCAIGLIVAAVIFGFNLGVVFSVAMVLLAGASILYDTQQILHRYPEDRYVGASLQLFASVAMLFWYVLRIFMSSRN